MGNIHINIDNELEKKWRQMCGLKFGAKKGSLQCGLEEGIRLWLIENKYTERFPLE